MPQASTLGLFALASLALIAIPGPSVIYIVTRSIEHGRGAGLISMLGVQAGALVHVTAAAVGRLSITWCCTPWVSSARPDGLGAAVAGTVPRGAAVLTTVVALLGVALLAWTTAGASVTVTGSFVVAAVVGLGAGALVLRRCVSRFGGLTGDVLGAVVEVTTAVVLVVAALALGLR